MARPLAVMLVNQSLCVIPCADDLFIDEGRLHVNKVFFVVLAGIIHEYRVLALDGQRHGPGLREEFWIIKGNRPLDVVRVDLLESLDQMQLIAVLVPGRVEPSAVIHICCVDDQRFFAFKMSDRSLPQNEGSISSLCSRPSV